MKARTREETHATRESDKERTCITNKRKRHGQEGKWIGLRKKREKEEPEDKTHSTYRTRLTGTARTDITSEKDHDFSALTLTWAACYTKRVEPIIVHHICR